MNKLAEMWDSRYAKNDYAYGTEPNKFFEESINKLPPNGKILFPGEGEGRNAVFAAKKGFDVTAFDISSEGRKKALQLAEKEKVEIRYKVGNLFDLDIINEKYDAAVLIFAHFPPPISSDIHKKIAALIKKGGFVLIEGFSKNHLSIRNKNPDAGGPSNIDMLYSTESLIKDFPDFEIITLEELEVELREGSFHNGLSRVIRFIGKK